MKIGKAAFLLVVLIVCPALADEAPESPAFRIAIEVSVRDEDLNARVSKYLRNELRAIADVELASEDPDYRLYVMLTEMRSSGGGLLAYVLGISVTSFFPDGYFDTVLRGDLKNADEVTQKLEAVPVYEHQFMSLAGPTEANLIETVSSAIANFDKHILEHKRIPEPDNSQ